MPGSGSLSQKELQQESIPASQGPDNRETVNLQPYKTSQGSVSERRMDRWTEYCSDLYNYETEGDPIVLDCPQIPDEE